MKPYRHLFGPVPSRRFGRSLGVDLVPMKTCSFDCVFCQLGNTVLRTVERREYVPLAEVRDELADWLDSGKTADCITLAGSGEPTLHSGFGDVLAYAKQRSRLPTVLLSNGALFHLQEVRSAAALADTVKVSLSAWDATSFARINRPHPELVFRSVVAGLKRFRAEFGGALWVEVFVVKGVNSRADLVKKIATLAAEIRPDRIHLNTAVRPAAGDCDICVPQAQLERLASVFRPRAEVIAAFATEAAAGPAPRREEIMAIVRRHPATAAQIASVSGADLSAVAKLLRRLADSGVIRARPVKGNTYYSEA